MNRTLKFAWALLLGSSLVYAACRKVDNSPSKTSTSNAPNQMGQVAVNLYKALTGQFGGGNINTGIAAPKALVTGRNSKVLQSVASLCGNAIDTIFNSTSMSGDTTLTIGGSLKFVFACDATSTVNGYTLNDTLTTKSTATGYTNTIATGQQYTATEVGTNLKTFAVNGQINSSINSSTQSPSAVTQSLSATYVLTAVNVDDSTNPADLTSGQATFTMSTMDTGPAFGANGTSQSFTGTISFLGNHMAKLVIAGGNSYSVNLITGVTTQL